MNIDFSFLQGFSRTITLAVATSGGSDSMALLTFAKQNEEKFNIKVVAINVEHGIRGENSKADSLFVKNYCEQKGIDFIGYEVDCPNYAKQHKLSIEESARILRYLCFDDAYNSKKFDFLATAHHERDNTETILFNLFRGASLKGICGIPYKKGYVVRPLLRVSKDEIDAFIKENAIPYVVDETNLNDDYTRNFIRLNLLPKIKEIFPDSERSISRLSEVATTENEFLDQLALPLLNGENGVYKIDTTAPKVLMRRALVLALKKLGVKKDWEKVHIDDCLSLLEKQNGTSINLPKNVIATKEYRFIVLSIAEVSEGLRLPFSIGTHEFLSKTIKIEKVGMPDDLTTGLFADLDKIPANATIRTKKDGDEFTKFGGGTKSLNDYLTDKKVPKRLRNTLPILAYENKVLAIFSVAISDKIKIDENTKNIIKFTTEKE